MTGTPTLYTSRWANPDLARLPVVPVGISRATPRWKPPYRYRVARLLAPSRETFALEDLGAFEASYAADLEAAGVEKIVAMLGKIAREEGGLPLALLCFEADRCGCHRSMFARWWQERTGQVVEELSGVGTVAPTAQPTLFDTEGDEA